MGKLILSGFTDEYASDFDTQLECAKRFGLQCLELRNADGVGVAAMTLPQVQGYAQKLRDNGIGVSAIGSPLGKIHLDEDLDAHMETARKIFEFANILDTKNIRMFSFYGPKDKPVTACKTQVYEQLGRLLELAKSFGVILCHENEAQIYGDTPQRCAELLEQFPSLACVFDMGNFVLEQVDPEEAYGLLKDRIRYFHIKDALAAGAVVPPGKGEAKIAQILQTHLAATEQLLVTLEPHLQTFGGLNALVGRHFENPYQYPDQQTAFADAVHKFKEMVQL